MASSIPTSTHVTESAVISAPFASVWHLIKLESFSSFWSALEKSEVVDNKSPDAEIVKWTFKDGDELEVKLEAHSTIDHYITYSVISAKPQLSYSSAVSTIRCFPITSGHHEGETFVQWSGDFSSDADAAVIQDARFKRKDALADLAKAAKK